MTDAIQTMPAEAVPTRPSFGPWRRAWRILKRDRPTLLAALVLFVIVLSSLAAPLYAGYVSGTDPFRSNLSARIMVDGKRVKVMQASTEGLALASPRSDPHGVRSIFLVQIRKAAMSRHDCSMVAATPS